MENTIFGFVLFLFVYGFLFWVTDGGNLTTASSTDSGIDSATSCDAETVSHKASNSIGQVSDLKDANTLAANLPLNVAVSQDKPIEQQLKDILWDDENFQQDEPATEQADTITEDEVNTLTFRQARKVARKLDIRQKVNGKDANKAWLIRQIKTKVRVSAPEVRIAYDEVISSSAA